MLIITKPFVGSCTTFSPVCAVWRSVPEASIREMYLQIYCISLAVIVPVRRETASVVKQNS